MPCMLDGREQFRFHTWPAMALRLVQVWLSFCLSVSNLKPHFMRVSPEWIVKASPAARPLVHPRRDSEREERRDLPKREREDFSLTD